MKKIISIFLLIFLFTTCVSYNVHHSRTFVNKINFPNLDGYITLLCDFHMHTVFSDGHVWPTVRVEEAYYDGLDAISITDHIEYRVNKNFASASNNSSYEIALTSGKADNVIIIKGSEITRTMPPGHFNVLFMNDCDKLIHDNYMDSFLAAKEQNAFFIWNHPAWKKQQHNRKTVWWPEHTELLELDMFHGIEVVNDGIYSPEAHMWCLEKNLAIISGTDSHTLIRNFRSGKHRTMTLVFARERSAQSIYEALMDKRTAIYHNQTIIGEEKYLREIFEKSVDINAVQKDNNLQIILKNDSELVFYIRIDNNSELSKKIYTLKPNNEQICNIKLSNNNDNLLLLIIENLLVGPNIKMKYISEII